MCNRYKANKHTSNASIACGKRHDKQQDKQTSELKGKQANKWEGKQVRRQQKVVSTGDKCRFESNVHNFIVLKHERHTSKQDSCMDMKASV